MESIAPGVYDFTPNARGRLTEPLRPTWQDVQPILPRLDALPVDDFIRRYWREVLHTESLVVQQALAGNRPPPPKKRSILVGFPAQPDIYSGDARPNKKRHSKITRAR